MLSFVRKIFFLLLLSPLFLFSQQNDSLKTVKRKSTVKYFNELQFENDSLNSIETTLYNFPQYLERNNLGNNGLAFNDITLHGISTNISYVGFNYAKNNYRNYFFTPQNFKYFNSRAPFTELFYVVGSKREQLFKMAFSYNVKKKWNFTANLNRTRSEGFYLRQNTNNNFIAISSNYKSENNRYYLLANIIYNSAKNSENGGILNDSIDFNGESRNKKLIAVNLSNAKRATINRTVYFKQYLNLGKKSQDTARFNSIIPKSRITLTSLYEDNILKYEDETPLAGYYSDIYYDSTRTFDTTYQQKIENELTWKRVDNKKHSGLIDMLGLGFSIKHQLVKVEQLELFGISDIIVNQSLMASNQSKIDTSFSNIITGAEFFNTYSKNKLWWNVSSRYGIKGFNKGDYYGGVSIKKIFQDSSNVLMFKADQKLQTADYIYLHYLSNHFKWDNDFGKMKLSQVMLHFSMKNDLAFSITYSNYNNVFYFNDSAIAEQDTNSISILSFFVKKDFVFYNWHLNNKITYQNVPNSSVIRLPEFILEHSLYYENDVFKAAMKLQIGASVFYNTAYYANAYIPATGQFFLQDKKKYGNYPFIDFFIAARIRTVRIFFKIDHLNSGLMEGEKYKLVQNSYMLTPNYPINDRAFKFGVSWMFYD